MTATGSYLFIGLQKLEIVFPPEICIGLCAGGKRISIILLLDQLHPWKIGLVEEPVHVFNQESLILQFKINDTQSTLIFRPADDLPSSQRRIFPGQSLSSPKAMPSVFIQLGNNTLGEEECAHMEGG